MTVIEWFREQIKNNKIHIDYLLSLNIGYEEERLKKLSLLEVEGLYHYEKYIIKDTTEITKKRIKEHGEGKYENL